MAGMFGGDWRSYYRIEPVQLKPYSPRFPKDRHEAMLQHQKNKANCEAFALWRKLNNYIVNGFTSRERAENQLQRFKVQPPVPVEIIEYMNL